MAKLFVQMSVSLDGFIEDREGAMAGSRATKHSTSSSPAHFAASTA
jgi:hypothetical protein